jgi:hypothetical protein
MFEGYSTRELAIYFTRGFLGPVDPEVTTEDVENKRIIVRDYLPTTSLKFQREFQEHLEDPSLGERDENRIS